MREIKLKWDAQAAFDRISVEETEASAFGDGSLADYNDCNGPYTPPSNVADWLALNKSRPVDPPRERDIEALRRAAFEPGSTPEKPIPKRGRTDDDCLREKFGGAPKSNALERFWHGGTGPDVAAKPAASSPVGVRIEIHPAGCECTACAAPAPAPGADSAVGEWPKWEREGDVVCRFDAPFTATEYRANGSWKPIKLVKGEEAGYGEDPAFKPISQAEALAWLESHGHAQVAAEMRGKVAGEFEPVGTIGREGDTVVWPWHVYDGWRREPHALKIARNGGYTFYDGYMDDVFSIADGDALALRILKRKNVAARAWKNESWFALRLDGVDYDNCGGWRRSRYNASGGYSSVEDWMALTCGTEIHDPAEIQRLVAELHAAGLGK